MRRVLKLVMVALVAIISFSAVAEVAPAGASVHTQVINPAPEQPPTPVTAESRGIRGPPYGTQPPYGRPRPTFVDGRPVDPTGDLICWAYDYIKNKCVGWRRKQSSSEQAPYPVPNHLWVDGSKINRARLGYFGTLVPDVFNSSGMICWAYDYTAGTCAGWKAWNGFTIWNFPILNYIWVPKSDLDFIRQGYYGGVNWFTNTGW